MIFRFIRKSQNVEPGCGSGKFWQLARHWKSGHTSKLELACEGGNLQIQLSATLGHPDHVHFPAPDSSLAPHPPPPPPASSFKKKSPSQLRRQVRRQEEALAKADKATPNKEYICKPSEKEVFDTPEEAENISQTVSAQLPAEKSAELLKLFKCDQCDHTCSCKEAMRKHVAEVHKEVTTQGVQPIPSTKSFKCDQCENETASDKGLKQHKKISIEFLS